MRRRAANRDHSEESREPIRPLRRSQKRGPAPPVAVDLAHRRRRRGFRARADLSLLPLDPGAVRQQPGHHGAADTVAGAGTDRHGDRDKEAEGRAARGGFDEPVDDGAGAGPCPGTAKFGTGAGTSATASASANTGTDPYRVGWLVTTAEAAVTGVTFPALGTSATVLVTEPAALAAARDLLTAELSRIDAACSRFRDDSELARVNRAQGRPVLVSALLAAALEVALRAARMTDGDVDPTCGRALMDLGYDRDFAEVVRGRHRAAAAPAPLPGWRSVRLHPSPATGAAKRVVQVPAGVMLDLGATAKALAADRAAAAAIAAALGCGVLVNLGGDIAVAGPPPGGGWRVRVTDDHAAGPDAPGPTVAIGAGGLATSSVTVRTWRIGGRRVHHIVAPGTGEPVRTCWRTVSVAAASCVDANAASTAAIIRGPAAPGWLGGLGLPARLVATGAAVTTVGGWPEDAGDWPTDPGRLR